MSEHLGFIKNLSWIAAGEMMVRVSRLVTTLILARYLSLNDYGVAALAVASAEIIRILASNGIGNLIVKAEDSKLATISTTVFWLNLSLGLVMFGLQYSLSPHIATLYDAPVLTDLLRTLAFTHLIYPFAMVQFNLLQRSNRMKEAGLIMGLTVTADNIIAAGLAISGFGVWSVIWPKIGAALIWVIIINRRVNWQPTWQFAVAELKAMRRYSGGVLLAECLKNGRNQIDLFILGRVLTPDLFGLYAFARNAGLGISLSLTQGFNTALLPKLCDIQRAGGNLVEGYIGALKTGMAFIAPIILLQAALAPIYVPILFGQQWADASILISCLCVSALPRMIFESGSMFFRASDDLRKENMLATVFTGLFCLAVACAAPWGALTVSMTMIVLYALAAVALITVIISYHQKLARVIT
ncbi:Teichuronic acid biosynthesis protein TuaB [Zhongshania aliphaticivorans]|uniref:Teichuronic acid biosynthesis protein TuaB n=1 Tax=Zhongshania aliphaticivorans TaxID=1470434 RepID=A0A5S9Q9T9_9GAMM|nr:oligosaccharide flippase family protein [Zhongshania aliphaticivorans]CAA0087010.1 Teichuronic acid biosynthesis protein TuaB [Zhongshania aliphaticivorans]CAA0113899.1 Teichuronic acid biosynthesis protein TuaB [Zhongshania aliphaticivorans]